MTSTPVVRDDSSDHDNWIAVTVAVVDFDNHTAAVDTVATNIVEPGNTAEWADID